MPTGFTSRVAAAVLGALVMVASALPAAAQTCTNKGEAAVTNFGRLGDPALTLSAERTYAEQGSLWPEVKARYFMLRMQVAGAVTADWRLTLRDADFRVIDILGPGDFRDVGPDGRWTGRLVTPAVFFDLHLGTGAEDVRVTVAEALIMPESAEIPRYSAQDPNNPKYKPLYDYAGQSDDQTRAMKRLGDRVGFLVGLGPDRSGKIKSWCCSGVMLTADLMLTNWHCGAPENQIPSAYWHQSFCRKMLIDQSWDGDKTGREFNCAKVEATSETLDYAVVRLASVLGSQARLAEGRPLTIAAKPVVTGQTLRVVHHAECKPKLVTHASCAVRNAAYPGWRAPEGQAAEATEFSHTCDTEGGSSGAPVFDASGALVGLHHLGFGRAANGLCDGENKAVHISRILDDLKRLPELSTEILARVRTAP